SASSRLQQTSKPEVKEVKLNERRRVAKGLDVPVDDRARDAQARALYPRACHANHDARHDADDRKLDRHQEAAGEAAAVELIVEDREIDSGAFIQPSEPIPDRLHCYATTSRTCRAFPAQTSSA